MRIGGARAKEGGGGKGGDQLEARMATLSGSHLPRLVSFCWFIKMNQQTDVGRRYVREYCPVIVYLLFTNPFFVVGMGGFKQPHSSEGPAHPLAGS